jgi:hypothetical protein
MQSSISPAGLGSSFVTLIDWVLGWWVGGQDPGWTMIGREVAAVRPVSRWLAFSVVAVTIVIAGLQVALKRRGEPVADVMAGAARTLLALSAGWLLVAAAWSMSEAVAQWLIGRGAAAPAVRQAVAAAIPQVDPLLASTLCIVGIAGCLGFVAVSLARVAIMIVVAFLMPAAAALPIGLWRALLAWVVAVIYRVGHTLITGEKDPLVVLLAAVLMFILAAAMLPILVRLLQAAVRS